MLVELSIRNLAVIEHVRLSVYKGFHVLTGETGAGKSIIIDALSLVVGGRGSADLVRHGSDRAEIEAMFDLATNHPIWPVLHRLGIQADEQEQLIVRREMTSQGKSTARINGQLVNLSMLREAGELLVNIHGQHEHQSLLKVDGHIDLLDLYGEESISDVKKSFKDSYHKFISLNKQLIELEKSTQQTLQMIDLYRFQADEIAAAGLASGEDESLMDEKRKLANAEKLMDAVSGSYDVIYGSKGLDAVGKAMSRLEDIVSYDASVLQPILEQIQSSYYQLEDAAYQLRDYRDRIEFNPSRLDQIERRLELISGLRRKYGSSVDEILEHLTKIMQQLQTIEHKDETIERIREEAGREWQIAAELASKLSEKRQYAAQQLSKQIEEELRGLQMDRTRFHVQIERNNAGRNALSDDREKPAFNENGWDRVEFLISANPGEPLRPLQKIASGGELSRIMLALKTIFAKMDQIPVLVFDEVDTGVSGRAAQAIAEKISKLSENCQVFCITHLPQVACMADGHFLIKKEIADGRTYTSVSNLSLGDRVHELARMLGGVEVTDTTKYHAEEMLTLANRKKARS
jgi:DNA repair protein RecN (Recombination protein N)